MRLSCCHCRRQGLLLSVLLDVARGMEWLHAHAILHGQLSAASVLLTTTAEPAAAPVQHQQRPELVAMVSDPLLTRCGSCWFVGLDAAAAVGGKHLVAYATACCVLQAACCGSVMLTAALLLRCWCLQGAGGRRAQPASTPSARRVWRPAGARAAHDRAAFTCNRRVCIRPAQ